MSETEHKEGYLVDTGKFFMDYIITQDIPEYYDDEMDYFNNECDAVIFEGTVWEVQDETDVCQDEDIFVARRLNTNLLSYEIKYYNGGCGGKEAIEYALENIKEK